MTRGFVLKEFQVNSIADFNDTFNYSFQSKYLKSNKDYLSDRFSKKQVEKIAGTVSDKLITKFEQGHFSTEKQLYNKTRSAMSWGNTVVNPALSAKELAVKAIKALLDNTVGKEM